MCKESCAKARAEAVQEAAARGQDPEPEKAEAADSPPRASFGILEHCHALAQPVFLYSVRFGEGAACAAGRPRAYSYFFLLYPHVM